VAVVFAAMHEANTRGGANAAFARAWGVEPRLATVSGEIVSEPDALSSGRISCRLRLATPSPGVEIELTAPVPSLARGDRVTATGRIGPLPPPRNPGQFDFRAWRMREGIHTQIRVEHANDLVVDGRSPENPLETLATATCRAIEAALTIGMNDPTAVALVIGMTIGETRELPLAVEEDFRQTGTFHLFSVSGLHVGIVAALLWAVLRTVRVPRLPAVAIIIPGIFFYALVTGWKPAGVRAAIMAALFLVSLVVARPTQSWNILAAAAFLLVALDTNELFHVGFQFSFVVVAAILAFTPWIQPVLVRPFALDPFFPEKLLTPAQRALRDGGLSVASLTAVSAAAWIGSLPMTVLAFHMIPVAAIAANLVCIPVSFLIMAVAAMSIVSAIVSPVLAAIFNQTNWLLAHVLIVFTQFLASLPGAALVVPSGLHAADEVVVFDCGDGGAVVVRAAGRAWVIDPGPEGFAESCLPAFLRSRGIARPDGMILTHGDTKHIGGAAAAIEIVEPRVIADSPCADRSPTRRQLHSFLAENNRPKTILRAGDSIRLGDHAVMEILHPPAGWDRAVADDLAMIVRITIRGTTILLLNDAGLATEQSLLANARDRLGADILVRGAPRSDYPGDSALLDAVAPQVVIQNATRVPRQPPRGVTVIDQASAGAVMIRVEESFALVKTFTDRDGQPVRVPAR
jgi:ComEC/Rec2-related protein